MPTLDWLNRATAFSTAAQVPYRLLDTVSTHGNQHQAHDNLLIQGDNLEALKALLPFYRGQVKCIFIDPPYNTQSAFEHYDDNLEHSQWLSMMLPRLQLLRELLREDGSIWVTIDDNEGHYLKVLMDEVFGRRNFLTTFIWQKSYGGGAKARHFVGLHEYIHCYAKNMTQLPDFFWPPEEGVLKYYKSKDDKFAIRGPYRLQPLATTSNDDRPNLRYPLPGPDGSDVWPTKQWQWSRERAIKALENDELVFTPSKTGYTVNYKQYLKDIDGEERRSKPKSIVEGHYTQHGTYESVALFGMESKFAFPKPEGIIERVLQASTQHGDLVLDSFLGSGTTAAVAHKMGRRWIGIEMGEHAATHCLPRLEKVIAGEQGGISSAVNWLLMPTAAFTPMCVLPRWRPLFGSKKPAPLSTPPWGAQARRGWERTLFLRAARACQIRLKCQFRLKFRMHRCCAAARPTTCCSTVFWATSAPPAATCSRAPCSMRCWCCTPPRPTPRRRWWSMARPTALAPKPWPAHG